MELVILLIVSLLAFGLFLWMAYWMFKLFFKAFAKPVELMAAAIHKATEAEAQRVKELKAWATAQKLRFDPTKDRTSLSPLADLPCLSQGSDRYIFNRTEGSWQGLPYFGFDFHYATKDSKGHKTHHYFSAVVITSDVPLKPLFLRPEGVLDRIPEFLGFDDIDFESAEFSRAFYVKAPDRRWAYDVLHQRTIEFLLQSPRFTIGFEGHHAMAYKSSLFSVWEFQAAADVLCGILKRLPEYVIQQQRSR